MRLWKPGDVAIGTWRGRPETVLTRWRSGWVAATDPDDYLHDDTIENSDTDTDYTVADLRPLVVIDPEDREQVERLREAFNLVSGQNYESEWTPDMQKALHRLIADPKPVEPTGLGAVVEDNEGRRWVRVPPRIGDFWWQTAETNPTVAKWPGIAAVRVLSEGVTA